MAGPPNPFAGLAQAQNQRNGTAPAGRGGGGRGGGIVARTSPFQPKNPGAPSSFHQTKPRGRGRGGPMRSRGRGAGTFNMPRHKPESVGASESPFSQLKQNKQSPSPFGGQPSRQQSPFGLGGAGGAGGDASWAPSSGGSASVVDKSRDPRKQAAPISNGARSSDVPVEDTAVLNSYNERYEQLKIDRAKERELAIKKGLMADPNQPTSLNQAITPVGTCTSMCPEFERIERIVQKMVDKSEKFLHPSTNSLQFMETKMLKRFRRSAAGYDEQLPSDIRTPKTLLQTMNYLIRHVIAGPEPLGQVHKFVWDRTRSIRNDFSVQQVTQEEHVRIAVTCLERIARFHIVSLHLLSSPANEEPFDHHQEREQLNNTMLSLMYYYDDNRGRISFPNEDEFRAYYIIFSIHDQRPDLEARVQKWPAELRNSTRVQAALELLAASGNTWDYQGTLDARRPNAIAQGFYTRFFELIDSHSVSYLMACVAEIYFNHVRQTAMRSIWKGYCRYPASQQHKNEEWTIDELTTVLCFDYDEQTIKFCEEQDLELAENANGDLYLNWGSRPVDSVVFQPSSEHSYSDTYVESKRAGRNLVAIILGLSVQEAASLGMIDRSALPERSLALAPKPSTAKNEDDALFVSDDENEIPAPSVKVDESVPEITKDKPSAPAFGFGNGFAGTAKPLGSEPSAIPPQQATTSQPSALQPGNPFSSMFGGNFGGAPAAPLSTAPAPNPFASFSSSYATPKPTPASQAPGPFSFSNPNPGPERSNPMSYTAQNPFAVAGQKEPTTAPPSTTSPFKFPSAFPSASSQSPASSPFGFPTTSTTTTTTNSNQSPGVAAGQPPKSFSDSTKPSIFSGNTTSPFSFGQSSAFKGSAAQESQISVSKPAQAPSLFAPKQDVAPSIFSPSTGPSTTRSSSIFAPKDTAMPPADEKVADKPAPAAEKPVEHAPAPEPERVPSSEEVAQQKPPHPPPAPPAEPAVPEERAAIPDITSKPAELFKPAEPAEPAKLAGPAADEEPSIDPTEKRDAWLRMLKEAADRRREESFTGRKRVHEEPEEPQPVKSGPKAAKMPKPEEPTARKTSMALSSVKPLPTLPILEQVKSSTARKPAEEQKPELKSNQVDEDELLLSAARIAAESLRSGPRLSDSWSTYASELAPRSSYSRASSLSSSLPPLSGSQSPQHSHINGHDLALAPDTDLGLGRTLSRTEQRLRLTGGKGLAYKPLDFTPEKKRKSLGDSW